MSEDVISWGLLALVVGCMLALDLFVLHRRAKVIPFRQAAIWSAVWIGLALAFGAYVAFSRGSVAGGEYLAGYLIELSLSVDNVFVFALIFGAFAVPAAYQHRLLFWGILGAIVFRGVFIAAGTAVLEAAHWVIYLLGVLLVVTGIRLARARGHAVDPEKNPVLRLFRRSVPMTDGYRGAAFLVREGGRRLATPLMAALVVVETTDVMFAIDSIPAVFAVTTDPFIVFSSNLFAILGLRSLYFLLAGMLDRFAFLKLGLAALLVFAGAKILIGAVYEIPIVLSLIIIVAVLGISIGASLLATRRGRRPNDPEVAEAVAGPVVALVDRQAGAPEPRTADAAGGLVGGTATAGDRPFLPPALRVSLMRIGVGLAAGIVTVASFAGIAALRDRGLLWLATDLTIVAGLGLAAVLVVAWLRADDSRSRPVRGWAYMAAALLAVIAAAVVALD